MESSKSTEILTPNDLPIAQYRQDIIEIVSKNLFAVVTGDTGSGKSTQLPQFLYDSVEIYKAVTGNLNPEVYQEFKKKKLSIVVTQPRRVAAIAMAKRVCYERKVNFGDEISYTVRFDDRCTENTKLRYVTDGILVRECLSDPDLSKYSIVVLDEAHERSIYTDILFALVKQAVIKRAGSLRLIVTSATLNTDQFSKYFSNCPVLKVEGRCYPVDILYGNCSANKRIEEAVRGAIRMHLHEGPGDILVFLPGSEDCEIACKLCISKLQELVAKGKSVPGMVIYPLYGAQSTDDQARIFERAPENTRKLIFATNIAETSLTIDGIGFVIDSGYVKQKCYNPRTGMDALLIIPISKVQAIQRAGRAGRTQSGKCYRMYSEQFFNQQMIQTTIPEILRVSLSNSILTLKTMGINDIIKFEFMEPPEREQVLTALKQLYLLDAIDEDGNITEFGREMSKFPLEPSYSKSLITSLIMKCDDEMLTAVSLLSSENIWAKVSKTNPEEYEDFCKNQKLLAKKEGDHLTFISLYEKWRKKNFSESWCKENFLNYRALRQAQNIRSQLKSLFEKIDLNVCEKQLKRNPIYEIYHKNKNSLEYEEIFIMALTTGFYFNSARRVANGQSDYLLIASGNIVNVDPSSVFVLKDYYPEYVIFTELGGTTAIRGIMRIISEINQEWVKPFIAGMKEVNSLRLAGLQKANENDVNSKRHATDDLEEVDINAEKRKEKLELAKQKLLERKKIKK